MIINNYLAFYTIDEVKQTVIIVRFLYQKSNWTSILRQGFSSNNLYIPPSEFWPQWCHNSIFAILTRIYKSFSKSTQFNCIKMLMLRLALSTWNFYFFHKNSSFLIYDVLLSYHTKQPHNLKTATVIKNSGKNYPSPGLSFSGAFWCMCHQNVLCGSTLLFYLNRK